MNAAAVAASQGTAMEGGRGGGGGGGATEGVARLTDDTPTSTAAAAAGPFHRMAAVAPAPGPAISDDSESEPPVSSPAGLGGQDGALPSSGHAHAAGGDASPGPPAYTVAPSSRQEGSPGNYDGPLKADLEMAIAAPGTGVAHSSAAPARVYRPEIDGLRGLGALYVASGHMLTRGATGGVGMFFCLCGILVLAPMHADAVKAGAGASPHRFLARSLGRIVPEMLTAVVLTVLLTVVLLPVTLLERTLQDAAAACLFVTNWRLQALATDYYARDESTISPLLLHWSLAVIVQTYVAHTVVYLGLAVASRVVRRAPAATFLHAAGVAVHAAAILLSLAYIAWLWCAGALGEAAVYFETAAWAWTFSVGALTGIALPSLRVPARVAAALAWTAVALSAVLWWCVLVHRSVPRFLHTGPIAAVVVAVVAGTASGSGNPALQLFRAQPLRYLGKLSFWIFLLHWPVFLVVRWQLNGDGDGGGSPVSPLAVAAIVLLIVVAGAEAGGRAFTTLRSWKQVWPAAGTAAEPAVLVACALILAAIFHGTAAGIRESQGRAAALHDSGHLAVVSDLPVPPARATLTGINGTAEPRPPRPPSFLARFPYPVSQKFPGGNVLVEPGAFAWNRSADILPLIQAGGYNMINDYKLFSEKLPPVLASVTRQNATARVVLVGASHMHQWKDAFALVAFRNSWQFNVHTAYGCDIYHSMTEKYPPVFDERKTVNCINYLNSTYRYLARDPPDVAFVMGTYMRIRPPASPTDPVEILSETALDESAWLYQHTRGMLAAKGTHVVALRNPPWPHQKHADPAKCIVAKKDPYHPDCHFAPSYYNASAVAASKALPNHTFVDMLDLFCPSTGVHRTNGSDGGVRDRLCPPVIGNVLVYWDSVGHITRYYTRTLANALEATLRAAKVPLPFRPVNATHADSRLNVDWNAPKQS